SGAAIPCTATRWRPALRQRPSASGSVARWTARGCIRCWCGCSWGATSHACSASSPSARRCRRRAICRCHGRRSRPGWPEWRMPADAETRRIAPAPAVRRRAAAPEPGTRLGPYTLGKVLGSGGMGTVYRCHDDALDRPAALKLLHPGIAWQEPDTVRREAAALSRLQHPNIATFYDAGSAGDWHYLAMELVDGEPLSRCLLAGALDAAALRQLATGLLWALAHAHAAGVMHRDIKPANILLRPDGQPVLLDFGIATLLREAGADASAGPGLVRGTPGYMAPEQLRGESTVPASDLYQAALVLVEAASGSAAAPGETAEACNRAILESVPAARAATLEEPFRSVLVQALEPDPGRRPAGATAMLFALGAGATTATTDEAPAPMLDATVSDAGLLQRAERAFRTGGKD